VRLRYINCGAKERQQSSLGWLWHRRLGHVGMKQLNRLLKHDLIVGLKNVKFEKDKLCSACQAGKQVANAHPTKSVMSTERPLELLHMDLFSPTKYRSIGGNCYYLVVVDDYLRYTCVFFLHDKADTYDIFKKYITRAENEFELKVKKVRSDNGSDVMKKESSMSSQPSTLRSKMVLLRGRIEL